ncbi:MAG: competence/damage-inducible protein A [Deltaproteobacteria bacterium]|nr:competence/damage-inducible protein A [Deltaproteobacteria bacterium]MDQ3298564.1 molybdopterin-binding protein [Myxococcota bacterium]
MATAGIVIIGDEILSGKFADENAQFLIGELRALGVELRRIVMIPDAVDDIAATVTDFARRFDHVFTSGGVGPTHDDVTMEGIARGFGTRVVRQPELEGRVRAYWGAKLAEPNLRLADVPEGCELVYGKDQIWPVVAYQNVYILPGVPALFRRKFVDIRDRFRAEPVTVARVYIDADEGQIADDLDAVVAAFPGVKIGSYPRFSESDFRVLITLEGPAVEEVAGAQRMLVELVDRRVGAHVVRHDEPALAGSQR